MRELTIYEIDQTAGGAALVALIGAFVGQLAYDAMGGADGIEDKVSKIYDLFTDSETRETICNNPIFGDSEYCS